MELVRVQKIKKITTMYINTSKDVDAYIKSASKETQAKLTELRAIIKSLVPKSEERISYGMPYYDYHGPLVYFAYAKKHIGLYVMPPVVEDNQKELEGYKTSNATVQLPLSKKLPIELIKKLLRAGIVNNKAIEKRKKEITKK